MPLVTHTPTSTPPVGAGIPVVGDWAVTGAVLGPVARSWEALVWAGSPGTAVKVNGAYYLYYVGADGYDDVEDTPTNRAIGVATSNDGRTFSRYRGNPIVTFSTAPQYAEESATNPVVLYENGSWHMWYAAGRAINSSQVDIEIRYRSSSDGLAWSGDTLVYRNLGSEYIPVNAFKHGSTYYLYVLGDLASGAGPLRVLSGSSPTSLSNITLVANGPFRGASGLSELDSQTLAIHLMGSSGGQVLAYTIDKSTPTRLSAQVRNYTFSGYGRHAVLRDGDTWLMYQLSLNADSEGIILRTARPGAGG